MSKKIFSSENSQVANIWITSPSGVIFILENMPDGIKYFSADVNSTLKLELLMLSIRENKGITVKYSDNEDSTVEAQEIRLSLKS